MSKAELVRRYVLFLFGLFVNSLGIALTTRANLGTSPITSVPYVLSIRFPLSLGMFTLFFSLLAIYGIKSRKWWWFIVGVLAINLLNADYANTGVILTLIFYLCRNRPWLGALIYVLSYISALWGGSLEDPLALVVGGHAVGFEIFAILAAPLIFLPTHVEPKIPKWFFYAFYPGHLFVIFLVRTVMGV